MNNLKLKTFLHLKGIKVIVDVDIDIASPMTKYSRL